MQESVVFSSACTFPVQCRRRRSLSHLLMSCLSVVSWLWCQYQCNRLQGKTPMIMCWVIGNRKTRYTHSSSLRWGGWVRGKVNCERDCAVHVTHVRGMQPGTPLHDRQTIPLGRLERCHHLRASTNSTVLARRWRHWQRRPAGYAHRAQGGGAWQRCSRIHNDNVNKPTHARDEEIGFGPTFACRAYSFCEISGRLSYRRRSWFNCAASV